MEIDKALTIQKNGIAVNVNFVSDDLVYVSKHSLAAADMPHNCLQLASYDYADFSDAIDREVENGAVVFSCVGDEDLPLPDDLVSR